MHELIGLNAEVIRCPCRTNEKMKGKLVDETKNTIVLELPSGGEKRIPKKSSVFKFLLSDGTFARIDGNSIAFRPEDRPKKLK